jgi:hypothetical protein
MKMKKLVNFLLAFVFVGITPVFAAHEQLCAVTKDNDLIRFYSDAPGTILEVHAITGLQPSEEVRGIDYLTDGNLYGLGSSSRLYTINPTTGAATQVGGGQFSPLLNGQSFGVDNGPNGMVIVSDMGQSLMVNRMTGVASVLPSLAYAPGDVNFGSATRITGLAYDSATAHWYAADSVKNALASINVVTGSLSTIGGAGIDFPSQNGLDISSATGIMYLASPAASSDPAANLYTVNKTTGAVTLVGLIGSPGDNILLRGLTVATGCVSPPVAGPDTMGTVENTLANAPVFKLLANDSSPGGGTLTITGVGSPSAQGGTVALTSGGTLVAYQPANNFVGVDQFNYTLSDGNCTALGTVNIFVTSANAPSLNQITLKVNPGANFIEFAGIPGYTYLLQAAPAVNGPWTTIQTIVVGPSGLITYNDLNPPPTRFYRTMVP